MLGDFNTQIGKIDYSQPRLGFEGLPELERFDICFSFVFVTEARDNTVHRDGELIRPLH